VFLVFGDPYLKIATHGRLPGGVHGHRRDQGHQRARADREFGSFTAPAVYGWLSRYKPHVKARRPVTFKCNFLPDDETQGFSTYRPSEETTRTANCAFRAALPRSRRHEGCVLRIRGPNISPGAPIAGALELNVTLRVTGPRGLELIAK